MSVTQIISATGTIVPTIVLGVSAVRESANITHPIIGRANADITLRPSALRSGTIELGFSGTTSEADSLSAVDIHASGKVLTLIHAERDSVSMTYVPTGRVERVLDDVTRDTWIVRVDYQEVQPS